MTLFKEKYGPVALVAGASEGLGAAWSKALAARGLDLVIIGRRAERLHTIAQELTNQFKVNVWPVSCDLGLPGATEQILQAIGDKPINCLVYNAASSYIGPFMDESSAMHNRIITSNITTPLNLVYRLAANMLQQRRGAVIFMASLAGFQGSGFLTTYASTKAFTRIFAESLWYEWKSKGVDVIACCAGATATPNYIQTKPGKISPLAPKPQQPEKVVEECLNRLGKTPSFISGTGNKVASFFMQHIFSRKKAITIMGDTTKKMYSIKG